LPILASQEAAGEFGLQYRQGQLLAVAEGTTCGRKRGAHRTRSGCGSFMPLLLLAGSVVQREADRLVGLAVEIEGRLLDFAAAVLVASLPSS
jgi:hypothetical protein